MNQYLLLFLFTFTDLHQLLSNKIYRLKEETEIGYVVDYIKSKDQNHLKIFNVDDKGVNCFDFEPSTGKFFIVKKIDREELCRNNRLSKYNGQQCEIVVKFSHKNVNFVQRLTIIIEDINDNAPYWKMEKVVVKFNENSPIGGRRSLPEAIDIDIGSNGQITYRMESKFRNAFRLFQDNGLYIENTQTLDREKKSSYEIIIIAQDSGIPYKTNELQVTVEIIDINDNPPKFTESIFRPDKLVPENVLPGTVILTLKAHDLDSENNGEFTFRMSPNVPPFVEKYFVVKSNGEIVIKSSIDYDLGPVHFEFKVIVQDNAMEPYSLTSEAVVEIDIQDINDENPQIVFYPRTSDLSRNPSIAENAQPMTTIGQISVTDRDFKGLDKVNCESHLSENDKFNPILVIPTNEPNEFNVVSKRKFDRENESILHAEIRCSDTADHVSKINITIVIIDMNDNPPEFNKNTYHFYMNENEAAGTEVDNKIFVIDRDSGINGIIKLIIESPGDSLFSIDQQSHVIKSKISFDREVKALHKLKILAIDGGITPLTSSCLVYVHIKDLNDNPVVMSSTFYTFNVAENKPRSPLGVIKASDLDNQTIFYLLDFKSQLKFTIEKYSGRLILQNFLDREEQDTYYITVTASDGFHTASATVTVFVDDENDNKPVFTSPTNSNKVIKIDVTEPPGYRICKIIATDIDQGNNGIVKYRLKKSTFKELLFNLDSDTGDLHLAVHLHTLRPIDINTYLDIEACDQGQPSLCTVLSGLEIQWISNKNEQTSKEGTKHKRFILENFLNENVLIAAISGLLIIMIVIMISFIIFKQKSTFFSRMPSRSNVSTVKKRVNNSMSCYRDTFATPEYHCSTELENLEPDLRQTMEITGMPIFQCSNNCNSDSKDMTGINHIFCETASRSMSPMAENSITIKDISRKSTANPENYYCKYFTDHSSNLTISDINNSVQKFSNIPKYKSKKNRSSFV